MGNEKHHKRKKQKDYQNEQLIKPKSKDLAIIYDAIADKVIKSSDLFVLDFKGNPKKEVLIDRVSYLDKKLFFKQPLKLLIEKKDKGFEISQGIFGIKVFEHPFSKALRLFQKEFYRSYTNIQSKKSGLKILYNSIVDTNKSIN